MPSMPDPTKTEYVFIDAWYSREGNHTVAAIDRTWRTRRSRMHYYNPTRASILRLSQWVKDSGATVEPWNFQIGWAASLTIEPELEADNA